MLARMISSTSESSAASYLELILIIVAMAFMLCFRPVSMAPLYRPGRMFVPSSDLARHRFTRFSIAFNALLLKTHKQLVCISYLYLHNYSKPVTHTFISCMQL